ncbi:MAG: hypothetical protein JW709_08740 [Sedimentisphaerales bacterium]|nr:hypothetical protein [Sedimentisphaerales bacterium]
MAKTSSIVVVFITIIAVIMVSPWAGLAQTGLERNFISPPDDARPWVNWEWINGNINREGITADLEAMARVGIGGVLIVEVDDERAPAGPVGFASDEWRDLFLHAVREAQRLGLVIDMSNDAGWAGSGGPWIAPELAMQKLVWTQTSLHGPKPEEVVLPAPPIVGDYYREVRVLAFPAPQGNARIDNVVYKSVQQTTDFLYMGRSSLLPTRVNWPEPKREEIIDRRQIMDLTDKMAPDGKLTWDVPEGDWIVLRLGHTLTGKKNHPAPAGGCGWECDKLSKKAVEAHFNGFIKKLADDAGELAGKSFTTTHIGSWEVGVQNWTADFRAEFIQRRGYDPIVMLPVVTGYIIDSREASERFLWDLRQTISELLIDNYAGHLRELANQSGLRLSIEGYTSCPCDELAYGGRADEPMGEFWTWWFWGGKPYGFSFTSREMTSSAHVYGQRIVSAEAFTATNAERWQAYPASIKEMGDWAFCEGINRFSFHRYAMQPWLHVKPGMAMGPWGLHYERTQTWWDMSGPWHTYLTRCQYMLRQGLFVADVLYLGAEGSPQSIGVQKRFLAKNTDNRDELRDRSRYNYDLCPPEVLLTRMTVKDGRLMLPDGMSYRLLALPLIETMTPELLHKVKDLVEAGATVVGPRPVKSPSLCNYPQCDKETKEFAQTLWGSQNPPAQLTERKYGKGRIFWSAALQKQAGNCPTPKEQFEPAQWIWSPEGDSVMTIPTGNRYFRRIFTIEADKPVANVSLRMHADNAFTCWFNGRRMDEGHGFNRLVEMNLTPYVKPGKNLIAVEAVNWGQAPNPAGLLAKLIIHYADGGSEELCTDKQWQSAPTAGENWNTDAAQEEGWGAVKELGPMGMAPWGDIAPIFAEIELFAEEEVIDEVFAKLNLPPDFDYQTESGMRSLRFIHRRVDDADFYFVANKLSQPEQALCSFRVTGKRPELWWPMDGRIELAVMYEESDGMTRLPITFEAADSVFVVFRDEAAPASERIVSVSHDGQTCLSTFWNADDIKPAGLDKPHPVKIPAASLILGQDNQLHLKANHPGRFILKTADGQTITYNIKTMPQAMEIEGRWQVVFTPGWGAPEQVEFDKLISWSEHPDDGVKHFSGTATYTKTFTVDKNYLMPNQHMVLDLGGVEVMADVTLNGSNLGVLWKQPYRVDVTDAIKSGENALEIKVANLWINRMIGDEQFPDDSEFAPNGAFKHWPQWLMEGKPNPTGRFTFTTWKKWSKDEPLIKSGLLGPVRLVSAIMIP